MIGPFVYLAGFDGLPQDDPEDYGVDRHGGPVVCGWMRDMYLATAD